MSASHCFPSSHCFTSPPDPKRLYLVKAFTAFALLLLAACLSPTAHAQSGSYTSPGPTGGQTISQPGSTNYYGNVSGGYGGSAGSGAIGNQTGSASCSGEIDQTYTWQGTDPAPQSVIVTQTSTASASSAYSSSAQAAPTCDDGLQDSPTVTSSHSMYGYGGGASSSGTHYTTQGGASLTVSCSPNASVSINSGQCWAKVAYHDSISPVTIKLTGAIQDSSSGNWDILIGQHCLASLLGIPSGCTASYQWKVGGTTFQTWSPTTPAIDTAPANPNASYYVDGPGPLNIATPSWYWNDPHQTPETVKCTATVTPPAGEGSPFTVTATKQVTVMVPNVTATGTGGNMQVNTAQPGTNGSDFFLHAGPTGSDNTGGMDFTATVYSPNPALFGDGGLTMVQLIIPNDSFSGYNDFGILCNYTWSLNGQEGLDGGYPSPTWNTGAPYYSTFDSPGLDLTSYKATSATMADQFEDYIMYTAPGSSQVVPVAHFVWSINGSASIPSSGNWADFTGSAGTVSPSGTRTPFASSNSFPSWTQIDSYANGRFSYFVH